MSDKSDIEWTDATWNPVRGCVKVSPGCKHCYAETFAERWRGVEGHPYEQGFDPMLVPHKLDEPLRWRKPRTIFVNSMSDLFMASVPFWYVEEVFARMQAAAHHVFQVLTKRGDRMADFFDGDAAARVADAGERIAERYGWCHANEDREWPLSNVHLGVSVEDRKYGLPRIDHLRATPAAVRFLSIEPLLEDLGTVDFTGIDQVIVGGESGHGARPMHEDWVRRIRDQAKAADCAFFYKQRTEKGRKVSLPMLDGRQWSEAASHG